MPITLLGLDSGFTATGLALVEWDGRTAQIVDHTTVTTSPTAKKRRLLVVDDHLRRIREIHRGILTMMTDPTPHIVVMEAFSQARNAAAAARQAFGYATAVVVCGQLEVPIIQFTPQQVHKNLGVPSRPPLPKSAPKGASKMEKKVAEKSRREAAVANKAAVWVTAKTLCSGPWDVLTEHEADAACAALAAVFPMPVDLVLAAMGRA
jgi:Holliday junction resolvasome RuvABC endonuclease subunit